MSERTNELKNRMKKNPPTKHLFYFIYYFHCKSTVHRAAWAHYTHDLYERGHEREQQQRQWRKKIVQQRKKRTPNIFFAIASRRLLCILSYTYAIHTWKTIQQKATRAIKKERIRLSKKEACTHSLDTARIRWSRRIYVSLCRPNTTRALPSISTNTYVARFHAIYSHTLTHARAREI